MTSVSKRSICFTCNNEKITQLCEGCSNRYCSVHLAQHQTDLSDQIYQIESDHDELRQFLNEQLSNPVKPSLLKRIDLWEKKSIEIIKQTAQQCRCELIGYAKRILLRKEKKLNDVAKQIQEINREKQVNENHLNDLQQRFEKLQKELHQSNKISVKERPASFINHISLVISSVGRGTNENSMFIFFVYENRSIIV